MKEKSNGMEINIIVKKWVWINNDLAANKGKHD